MLRSLVGSEMCIRDRYGDPANEMTRLHHLGNATGMRDHFPHHEPGHVRLNNGSYGATPACVLAAAEEFRRAMYASPDEFMGGIPGAENPLYLGMEAAREAVALHVARCKPEDVVTTIASPSLQHRHV
eukprot:TRINITY_DN50899_c0_g1_i1.p1 TRINITY_DN50899_c0_g1~~TRINITY_DN50899_c0_g1_i1.p1  ORF type:complete len:146 (+),score=43.08 TRINITY_DN50899_c0_g1_i1:56-439(+)